MGIDPVAEIFWDITMELCETRNRSEPPVSAEPVARSGRKTDIWQPETEYSE